MLLDRLFRKAKRYAGPVVDLKQTRYYSACERTDFVDNVVYDIVLHESDIKVGTIDLRLGMNELLYYAGNIGYNVIPYYRGHSYAYEACRVLFRVALEEYHMHELIITCSPENVASHRTLEKLGGVLVETTDVPEYHWLSKRGENVKEIFQYIL